MEYDYLIVGAGLFGATFAHQAHKQGKRCLVIDRREHLGGNVYCENIDGINVHKYGAHIFHTNNKEVWDFVNSIVPFNRYTNSPVANYKGKLYNLPFNMNTFYQMWGVTTPAEAQMRLESQRAAALRALDGREPQNLEEQARRSNGDAVVRTCRHSSSSVSLCVWSSTTTISTTDIREYPLEDTTDSLMDSSRVLRREPA